MVFKSFSFGANKRRKVQITELSFELRIIYETATASTSLSSHAVRTPATENRPGNGQMGPHALGFARNHVALARPLLATRHRPLGPAPRAPAMRQCDCRPSASPSTPARSKSTSPRCAFASCRSRAAYKTSLRAPHAPRHPFPHPPHAIANGEQSSPWRRLLCPHIAQIGHPASFSSSP